VPCPLGTGDASNSNSSKDRNEVGLAITGSSRHGLTAQEDPVGHSNFVRSTQNCLWFRPRRSDNVIFLGVATCGQSVLAHHF